MLYLYQSNRLEYLAEMMTRIRQVSPLDNPFAAEQIVVQSQGMRRYISQHLARETGIAANLHFSLPAGLAWHLMREASPDIPELNPFASEVMRWRLLDLFQSDEFAKSDEFAESRQTLHSYLANGGYATYQLAGQLADVFDQYLVYRPDWIEAWAKGDTVPDLRGSSETDPVWQTQIWRHLDRNRSNTPHRVQLWRTLMQSLETPNPRLPQRYFVFGIATLAPMYLQLLAQLAQHRDVHIFALNPSAEYWGNVIEPAQILHAADDADLSLQGHPLLASLGKQGRDFFNELAEAKTRLAESVFDKNPISGCLLHTIQHQIQTLTLPEADCKSGWAAQHQLHLCKHVFPQQNRAKQHFQAACEQIEKQFQTNLQAAQTLSGSLKTAAEKNAEQTRQQRTVLAQLNSDPSLQIHSAHSPLRELQILKDQLLALLAQHPDWQPHDIAVLTPHIEPYAPYIEAVFGRHTAQPLPYSLSDIKLSRRRPLFDTLAQTLELLDSRFEADKLLALLDSDLILRTFQLTRNDLPLLHDTTARLNIRWGSDAEERAQFLGSLKNQKQPENNLFTWQQGLQRLILGFMLPENTTQDTSPTLWQNIAPYASNPTHLDTLARFAALVTGLSDTKREWQQPATVADWCSRVRTLVQTLATPESDDDRQALQQLETALANWQNEADTAGFARLIDRSIALQHLSRFLDSQSDAGFLRGGITFCSMVPMRSLPFKVLCLLGLNDGDFPRNTKAAPFDLIARHPRKGDRARRDDDRYLFLESLLSAREVLYLSYIGKDIRTDEERAPSTLIGELIDTVSATSGVPADILRRDWVTQHPLQAFSRQYFSSNPKLRSSRQDYADALNHPLPPDAEFWTPAPQNPDSRQPENPVSQKTFLRFWRNPVRVWLQTALGWNNPYPDSGHSGSEPFLPDRPRLLDDAYTQTRRHRRSFDSLARALAARSLLPEGEFGELVRQDYAAAAAALDNTLLDSPALPDCSGTLDFGSAENSGSLNYTLAHNFAAGQILYAHQFLQAHNTEGRLRAADQIELLLRHLIYCAAAPADADRRTHYLSTAQSISLPSIGTAAARTALADWFTAYQQGQHAPLPFFPRVTLAAAQTLYAKPNADWQRAQAKAAKIYHQGYNGFAQADYPETKLVYGRATDAEPPYQSKTFRCLTENLFAPLAECLKVLQAED